MIEVDRPPRTHEAAHLEVRRRAALVEERADIGDAVSDVAQNVRDVAAAVAEGETIRGATQLEGQRAQRILRVVARGQAIPIAWARILPAA